MRDLHKVMHNRYTPYHVANKQQGGAWGIDRALVDVSGPVHRRGVKALPLCWPGGDTPPSGKVTGRLCRGRSQTSTHP